MLDLTLIVLLLVANGFFVAAEFALVKAREFRIESLATEGRFGARLTSKIQNRLESYLATCQLGITMASLGLGWVGEPAVEALLHPLFAALKLSAHASQTIAFLTGFILFSSLHIVVGEQVPKTFAIRKPEPVSLWCAYPLQAFYLLTYPLNWLLAKVTATLLAWFGVQEATHGEILSGDEIEAIAKMSGEGGGIAHDKAAMVSNVFAFDVRTVSRVMIPRSDIVTINANASMEINLAVMHDNHHSRFPIFSDDPNRPAGVVLAKEVFLAALQHGDGIWGKLIDYARAPVVVPEMLKLSALFEIMREGRTHMAFVVDEYGEFVGLITIEDLLEEIVGEITDETDVPSEKLVVVRHDGGWEAAGLASLTDIHREIGLAVPPELDANTLSGLLMQRLGRMPSTGDEIYENDFCVRVLAMRDNHVERVQITKCDGASETTASLGC